MATEGHQAVQLMIMGGDHPNSECINQLKERPRHGGSLGGTGDSHRGFTGKRQLSWIFEGWVVCALERERSSVW